MSRVTPRIPLTRRRLGMALCALHLAGCAATPAPATPAPAASCPPVPTQSPESIAPSSTPAAPRKLVIENSELIDLHSEQTGRDYELIVGLPDSYGQALGQEPARRYPVLYLLDGQWDFNLVNTLASGLRYDKVVPEFVIVGITYAGQHPEYGKLRGEDYAPTRAFGRGAKEPSGGDAPKFLRFLEQNVISTVEQRYRVDAAQRMLAGASAGGLFTLYTLLEKPDLFQSYLALSPSVGWDDRYLFRREREFHVGHPALNKRVWLSIGELEWTDYVKNAKDFFTQFEASHYESIALRVQVVPGERHAGEKPEAFNRALRFAFEPWAAAQKQD